MILWYDLIQFYKHVQTCPWWYVLIRFLSMSRLVWKWIHDEIAKNGSNLSEWQTIIPWWKSYSLDRFDKRAVKNVPMHRPSIKKSLVNPSGTLICTLNFIKPCYFDRKMVRIGPKAIIKLQLRPLPPKMQAKRWAWELSETWSMTVQELSFEEVWICQTAKRW